MLKQYKFYKTKYGDELLIDLVRLEDLQRYVEILPTHTLQYFDITIIESGSGLFYIDGVRNPIEHGQIFFSAPGQIRQWECGRMPKGWALLFEADFLCAFFNDAQFVQNLPYFNNNQPSLLLSENEYAEIEPIIKSIRHEISENVKDKHILRALLYHVTMLLCRCYRNRYHEATDNRSNFYIQKFKDLVEIHFASQRNLKFYAEKLFITSGYLNEVVKQALGISAKQYILDRTLREAKRLIGYTDLSISEIAQKLTFESTSYFVRIFSKKVKQTPLRFREEIRKK